MKAKELMTAPAIFVRAETTLQDILDLVSSHRLTSVPVVDESGQVIGMIGYRELFPRAKNIRSPAVRAPVVFKQIIDLNQLVDNYRQFAHLTARDVMSPAPLCVDVDDPVRDIVWRMADENLDMIPVLQGERLAGILTRQDVLRFLAQEL